MSSSSLHDIAIQVATLEERMNTKQAEYETAIERLGKQLAERDRRFLLVVIGAIAFGVTILGILIRWPG